MKNVVLVIACIFLTVAGMAHAQEEVQVDVLVKSTQSWDGSDLPAYPDGRPEISIQRYHIPGNTTLPWHRHPVINAGVLLSGRLTVVTRDGARLELSPGDPIVETVETWHQGINEHEEPVELIVFYAGVVDEPLTVQEQ